MQRLGRTLLQLAQAAGLRAEAGSSTLAARWSSSAAASAAPPVDLASVNPLNRLQAIKRSLRPQDSGRNAFRRAWAKQLQIKWDAQRKAAERAAARKRKHAAQLEKYKQRRAAGEAAAA